MAIKVGGATVITNSRGVEGMSGIQGSYDDFHPTVVPISTVLNMLSPCMSVTLSAATTFTATNIQAGRVALLLLDVSSSGHLPTWPASIQWPGNGTEPDWDATGIQTWVVCFTCWDNSTIRATATGWGDAQTASVDLGAQDRSYHDFHLWDEVTSPHGKAAVQATFTTTGAVNYTTTGTTTTGSTGVGSSTNQSGSSEWGSGVTGSDYEVKFQFTTSQTGGGLIVGQNNVWLPLSSNRTWSVETGTIGNCEVRITGTVSIRNASTQGVLDTQTQELYAHFFEVGVGNTCLTNNMRVYCKDKGLIRVYDLEVGDMIVDGNVAPYERDNSMSIVTYTEVTALNKDHLREGYYTVDGWLEITNDHPMFIKGEWVLPPNYSGNKVYTSQDTDTVYVETASGQFEVWKPAVDGESTPGIGDQTIIVSGNYAKGAYSGD